MSQNNIEKPNHIFKINHRTPPPFPNPSCPRCFSSNTKFCYYNNYSESQPRYFCKNCRRYWTHGGVVRNLPSSRKRGRTVSSSPLPLKTSQGGDLGNVDPYGPLIPPPLPVSCSIGDTRSVTLGAPSTETTQAISGVGGGYFNPMQLKSIQGGDLGNNVNSAFGHVVNVRAPLPPDPLIPLFSNLSPLNEFCDFGLPIFQPPQFQLPPPPQPPTVWTSLNMANPNNFMPITRDLIAPANVVNINEWPEFNDLDTFKQASP